jgi:hypothetical protein
MSARHKTVTKSFRVSEGALQVLSREAERQRVSLNTFVNQLFIRYAEFHQFARRAGSMVIPRDSMKRILDSSDEEALREAGRAAAASMGRAIILARDGHLSLDSIMRFTQSLADYANFFEMSSVLRGDRQTLTLLHGLGFNWTVFISHYLQSLFEDAGVTPSFTLSENSIVIEFKVPG